MDASTIAAAKYRAGLAAGVVAEHAHQLHGAIGYTGEFGLARLNRRLWQWREDFGGEAFRSEEHTSELQSLMRSSYAVFCLKKKKTKNTQWNYKKQLTSANKGRNADEA